MLDALLYIFGPELAHKMFANKDAKDVAVSNEEFVQVIEEIVKKFQEAEASINRIKKDIQTLSPVNISSELGVIFKWMEDHTKAERQILRRQRYWTYGFGALAAIALILAIVSLVH